MKYVIRQYIFNTPQIPKSLVAQFAGQLTGIVCCHLAQDFQLTPGSGEFLGLLCSDFMESQTFQDSEPVSSANGKRGMTVFERHILKCSLLLFMGSAILLIRLLHSSCSLFQY